MVDDLNTFAFIPPNPVVDNVELAVGFNDSIPDGFVDALETSGFVPNVFVVVVLKLGFAPNAKFGVVEVAVDEVLKSIDGTVVVTFVTAEVELEVVDVPPNLNPPTLDATGIVDEFVDIEVVDVGAFEEPKLNDGIDLIDSSCDGAESDDVALGIFIPPKVKFDGVVAVVFDVDGTSTDFVDVITLGIEPLLGAAGVDATNP